MCILAGMAGSVDVASRQEYVERSPVRALAELVSAAWVQEVAKGAPAHERVIRTLRAWNIRIDEVFFLGGLDKGEILRAFGADIFFDDQRSHIESAMKHVASGHVPHGIANESQGDPI